MLLFRQVCIFLVLSFVPGSTFQSQRSSLPHELRPRDAPGFGLQSKPSLIDFLGQLRIQSISSQKPETMVDQKDNLVVLFSESARCHFCTVLCPDRATLKAHLEDTHQPPRHALCENCENFFHICAITRHRSKCMERYQQQSDNINS